MAHENNRISLIDGKYVFYRDLNLILVCDRYGSNWREFLGDKAINALFDEAIALREERDKLRAALEHSRAQWIHSVNAPECLTALQPRQE